MEIYQSVPAVSGVVVSTSNVLRMAIAAHLARFKGQSRVHTESDLRAYLLWFQGLYCLSSHVGRGWFLPDVCNRWRPRALPS